MSFQRPAAAEEIWRAYIHNRRYVTRTPLRQSAAFSERYGAKVYLKFENLQPTGSFKVRGAVNFLSQLSPDDKQRGLVTASAGNHALAVGYAAQKLGAANVTIFVPTTTPRAKVNKLRRFPVTVQEVGTTYDDAHHAAVEYEHAHNAVFVHAYDDARTVAGAGSIAIEILEDLPDVDALFVPVGGGGLISGVAGAIRTFAPQVKVYGVQPEASPALRDSLRDETCYEEYDAAPTICDGLAGGIGQIVYEVARKKWIEDVIVVSEAAVKRAVAAFVVDEQQVVEGSGAVGLGALEENASAFQNQRVALIVTGANMDARRLSTLIEEWV